MAHASTDAYLRVLNVVSDTGYFLRVNGELASGTGLYFLVP